jgi:citrate synthase
VYRPGEELPSIDRDLDLVGNYARMLGYGGNEDLAEYMRLYIAIHGDHEGGNASAHTARTSISFCPTIITLSATPHYASGNPRDWSSVGATIDLVGSTLADPYLAYSAALFALAGPLHGLANQEVLRWQLSMRESLGDENINHDAIRDYLWKTLKGGQVVPGWVFISFVILLFNLSHLWLTSFEWMAIFTSIFSALFSDALLDVRNGWHRTLHRYGHGVLRSPDPRFTALLNFTDTRPALQQDPVVQLVKKTFEVAPGVLTEHGKTKNPFPNVDAASGSVLYHYGITQFKYYTVIFGVSRALGCLTQVVWARALGLPIERPKCKLQCISLNCHDTKCWQSYLALSMDAIEKLIKQ